MQPVKTITEKKDFIEVVFYVRYVPSDISQGKKDSINTIMQLTKIIPIEDYIV